MTLRKKLYAGIMLVAFCFISPAVAQTEGELLLAPFFEIVSTLQSDLHTGTLVSAREHLTGIFSTRFLERLETDLSIQLIDQAPKIVFDISPRVEEFKSLEFDLGRLEVESTRFLQTFPSPKIDLSARPAAFVRVVVGGVQYRVSLANQGEVPWRGILSDQERSLRRSDFLMTHETIYRNFDRSTDISGFDPLGRDPVHAMDTAVLPAIRRILFERLFIGGEKLDPSFSFTIVDFGKGGTIFLRTTENFERKIRTAALLREWLSKVQLNEANQASLEKNAQLQLAKSLIYIKAIQNAIQLNDDEQYGFRQRAFTRYFELMTARALKTLPRSEKGIAFKRNLENQFLHVHKYGYQMIRAMNAENLVSSDHHFYRELGNIFSAYNTALHEFTLTGITREESHVYDAYMGLQYDFTVGLSLLSTENCLHPRETLRSPVDFAQLLIELFAYSQSAHREVKRFLNLDSIQGFLSTFGNLTKVNLRPQVQNYFRVLLLLATFQNDEDLEKTLEEIDSKLKTSFEYVAAVTKLSLVKDVHSKYKDTEIGLCKKEDLDELFQLMRIKLTKIRVGLKKAIRAGTLSKLNVSGFSNINYRILKLNQLIDEEFPPDYRNYDLVFSGERTPTLVPVPTSVEKQPEVLDAKSSFKEDLVSSTPPVPAPPTDLLQDLLEDDLLKAQPSKTSVKAPVERIEWKSYETLFQFGKKQIAELDTKENLQSLESVFEGLAEYSPSTFGKDLENARVFDRARSQILTILEREAQKLETIQKRLTEHAEAGAQLKSEADPIFSRFQSKVAPIEGQKSICALSADFYKSKEKLKEDLSHLHFIPKEKLEGKGRFYKNPVLVAYKDWAAMLRNQIDGDFLNTINPLTAHLPLLLQPALGRFRRAESIEKEPETHPVVFEDLHRDFASVQLFIGKEDTDCSHLGVSPEQVTHYRKDRSILERLENIANYLRKDAARVLAIMQNEKIEYNGFFSSSIVPRSLRTQLNPTDQYFEIHPPTDTQAKIFWTLQENHPYFILALAQKVLGPRWREILEHLQYFKIPFGVLKTSLSEFEEENETTTIQEFLDLKNGIHQELIVIHELLKAELEAASFYRFGSAQTIFFQYATQFSSNGVGENDWGRFVPGYILNLYGSSSTILSLQHRSTHVLGRDQNEVQGPVRADSELDALHKKYRKKMLQLPGLPAAVKPLSYQALNQLLVPYYLIEGENGSRKENPLKVFRRDKARVFGKAGLEEIGKSDIDYSVYSNVIALFLMENYVFDKERNRIHYDGVYPENLIFMKNPYNLPFRDLYGALSVRHQGVFANLLKLLDTWKLKHPRCPEVNLSFFFDNRGDEKVRNAPSTNALMGRDFWLRAKLPFAEFPSR